MELPSKVEISPHRIEYILCSPLADSISDAPRNTGVVSQPNTTSSPPPREASSLAPSKDRFRVSRRTRDQDKDKDRRGPKRAQSAREPVSSRLLVAYDRNDAERNEDKARVFHSNNAEDRDRCEFLEKLQHAAEANFTSIVNDDMSTACPRAGGTRPKDPARQTKTATNARTESSNESRYTERSETSWTTQPSPYPPPPRIQSDGRDARDRRTGTKSLVREGDRIPDGCVPEETPCIRCAKAWFSGWADNGLAWRPVICVRKRGGVRVRCVGCVRKHRNCEDIHPEVLNEWRKIQDRDPSEDVLAAHRAWKRRVMILQRCTRRRRGRGATSSSSVR
ncbi:uncharacterized protein DSM5745_00729 [Aspergillus mulundensis]|uniref:Uncharacterized protein n=1 Tax=Aspergillus mulundensis TaxID=1810919 RepID=A0A3D8T4B9_9EURO|nr:hypothetical protein DSM5745_00729 [Aspergillus mulundensis]RDW93407.1 hypothetical protein DSM5745_00729 [Aspergillus mulundensis]